jgi:hypothetical protein
VLPRGPSDHRPIIVHLAPTAVAARRSEPEAAGTSLDRFAKRISASLKRRVG